MTLVSGKSFGQENKHNQIWTDVSASLKLSKKLTLTPELGYRTEPGLDLHQAYLRTYFSYRPNKTVKLSAWAAQFNSWRPGMFRGMEVRTSQFVYLFWPRINGFKFEHRFGFDQRMFYLPGYELRKQVHRSRFKIALHSPKFSVFEARRKFYANAGFEILRNMNQGENGLWIDHDWVTAAFGMELNDEVRLEANMLLINCLNPLTYQFEREITVFRLRLKCKL